MRIKIKDVGSVSAADVGPVSSGRIVELDDDGEVESCFICDRPETSRSPVVEDDPDTVTRYCCDEHRELHQPDDENMPFPLGVRYKEACGRYLVRLTYLSIARVKRGFYCSCRYMVATRDIEAGDLIFYEEPLLIGPSHSALPSCLDCMKKVDGSYVCPNCNFPMCSEMCAFGPEHAAKECAVFSKVEPNIEVKDFSRPDSVYWNITVLRGLLLKEEEPDKWAMLERMMDHNKDRRAGEDEDGTWGEYMQHVVEFLRKRCRLADRFTEAEVRVIGTYVLLHLNHNGFQILHVLGLIDVNSVRLNVSRSIPNGTSEMLPGHALYPVTALISHSCICNSKTIVRPDYSVECRATAFIPKGDEISKQYVSPLETTNMRFINCLILATGSLFIKHTYYKCSRRRALSSGWYFDCSCPRCCDPRENDSFVSATSCLRCQCGTILPTEPLNPACQWLCDTCDFKTNGEAVDKLVAYFMGKIQSTPIERVDELLELLEKALKMFHNNHYVVTLLRINLNTAYLKLAGRMGMEPHKVPVELHLKRKEFLDEVHKTIEIVEPGLSRRRGEKSEQKEKLVQYVDLVLNRLVHLGISLFEVATCHLQIGKLLHDDGRFSTQDFKTLCHTELESLKVHSSLYV